MFTGLTADIGEVEKVDAGADGARLRVRTRLARDLSAGDSVLVNGVCLTAAEAGKDAFEADVMKQTLSLSTLGPLGAGDRVNLELALAADARLGGHFVQGHVDATGEVVSVEADGFARRLRVKPPAELLRYIVARGSIAVDGVSLTVAGLDDEGFEVSLIPETLERTTLGEAEPGRRVNLEVDLLAKYAEKLIDHN